MYRNKTFNRKKILFLFIAILLALFFLIGRLTYLMIFQSEYYGEKAENLHERERDIKAARGKILDRSGTALAVNKSVCTISVIHNQIEEPEAVIDMLIKELGISEETARKRVEKVSAIERVKTNVEKETGDRIRSYGYAGVKVDEDYKRHYPYDTLASKVLGFTGADNQGIIGLEAVYDTYLKGIDGKILTLTDAKGIEIENAGESRIEPENGSNLRISMDYNIQTYCMQAAQKVYLEKSADSVNVIVMDPQNGELIAMVNYPEFDLNEPFTLVETPQEEISEEKKQELLNKMWRNQCVSDTYEPGSTFKIITAAAALEEQVVALDDNFYCPGYKIVEDRHIRCSKTTGHGAETFETGMMNSCNPVFMEVGERLGAKNFLKYFKQFGLLSKTGTDLPGEAATIMHQPEKIGPVELATISFGQSFQVTPIQLAATVSSILNGGKRVIPHFGVDVEDEDGKVLKEFTYGTQKTICSVNTSETLRYLLEKVVSEGTGKNAKVEGFEIGGKTATSQTLPRSARRYIASFLGFAPATEPRVLLLVMINNPQGMYYGGTVAAPVAGEIFENILPYLDK